MNSASLTSRFLRRVITQERVIVTGGPAVSHVDAMRVLTNRSTGELAIRLANALAEAGAHVDAWIGEGATSAIPRHEDVRWRTFSTNQDVLDKFIAVHAEGIKVAAVFHAAALSDFIVDHAEHLDGRVIRDEKISSKIEEVRLVLKSAPKVLRQLRSLFPLAYLCGWKFEAGDSTAARNAAQDQIHSDQTDACVLNGPALGNAFEWHRRIGDVVHMEDRAAVAAVIVDAFAAGECIGPLLPE